MVLDNEYMNFSQKQIIVLGIIAVVVLIFVLGLLGIIPGFKKENIADPNFPSTKFTMEMWGVGDEYSVYNDIIKAYQQTFPTAKINYTKFDDADTYQKELINALAENRGPDIFMVKNTWAYKHFGKIFPANGLTQTPLITPQEIRSLFPAVVTKDFVINGAIYALPLNMDALALIYNKDVFDSKGIVYPPKTWDEFVSVVSKIKEVDENKKISLAAASFGTAKNINHLKDILSVLMFQSGSIINNPNGEGVSFDDITNRVVKFYTQFSDPVSPYYTWNESFDNSLSTFASRKTSMIFEYYSSLAEIKNRNPYLNYAVADLPQIDLKDSSRVSNASQYWGLTVSKQSQYTYPAWHFIKYLTTTPGVSSIYLEKTTKLPALLSLIQSNLGGDNDVFVRSALTAKSWYQADDDVIEKIFSNMIGDILSGRINLQGAVNAAEEEINNLYKNQ